MKFIEQDFEPKCGGCGTRTPLALALVWHETNYVPTCLACLQDKQFRDLVVEVIEEVGRRKQANRLPYP